MGSRVRWIQACCKRSRPLALNSCGGGSQEACPAERPVGSTTHNGARALLETWHEYVLNLHTPTIATHCDQILLRHFGGSVVAEGDRVGASSKTDQIDR